MKIGNMGGKQETKNSAGIPVVQGNHGGIMGESVPIRLELAG